MKIDLNCDLGESFGVYTIGNDEALLLLITSANIACGYHAGDPQVMARTVRLAAQHGVAVGAHPGFPDLAGFGRRAMQLSPEEVETCVLYQVGALAAFTRAAGVPLGHVKPHGALYNLAVGEPAIAAAIARGVASFSRDLILVGLAPIHPSSCDVSGLAGSPAMAEAAQAAGLSFAAEAFADRVYNPDGTLQSRRIAGSLITDPTRAAAQAVSIARDGLVVAHDGTRLSLHADTLCLHGDNPAALANAPAVRQALAAAGVTVQALAR
jgi:UPF0271 protein